MESLLHTPQTFFARVPVDPAWNVTADVVRWVRILAGGDRQKTSLEKCLTARHLNVALVQVGHRLYETSGTASCFSVQIAGFEVLPDAPLRMVEPEDVLELVPKECSTLSYKRRKIDPAAGANVAQQTSQPALEVRAATPSSSTATSSSSDDESTSSSEDTSSSEEASSSEQELQGAPNTSSSSEETEESATSSEEVRRLHHCVGVCCWEFFQGN